MNKNDFAGIEVSREELLVALRREEQTLPLKSFPNTPQGYRAVARYLARQGRRVRVCLESTGVYGLDVALLLHQRPGVEVRVANPRAVRHFAQALTERSKTDPLDARVLLEFAERMPFQLWQPPSATTRHLCALARRIEAVTDLCTAEKNRLHAASAAQALLAVLRQEIRRSIAFQERALKRRALYMPALVAVRHDPHLRAFYQHLLVKGKAKLQALVAVMRKLLHAIFGMFKHRQAYDGAKLFPLASELCAAEVA